MRRGDGPEKSDNGRREERQEQQDGTHGIYSLSRRVGPISRVIAEITKTTDSTRETVGRHVSPISSEAWFDRIDETSPTMRMAGPEEYKGEVNTTPTPVTPKQIIEEAVDDLVNHPSHYTDGAIECIDAIQAQLTDEEFRGYLKGNIAKYIWREKHKGGTQSIEKGAWYLNRLIQLDKPEKPNCMRPFVPGFDD